MRRLLVFAAALLAVPVMPAAACSPADDYRLPSNLEQVAAAELIVIGTVVDGREMDTTRAGGPDDMELTVRPTAWLKGKARAGDLKLFGMIAPPRLRVKTDPRALAEAHPLAQIGGCVRYMFERGQRVLFLLKRAPDGTLEPATGPFTRWAEDVVSRDAPWARAVALYVRVAALPAGQRVAALKAERARLAAMTRDADAAAIVADIDRTLAWPGGAPATIGR